MAASVTKSVIKHNRIANPDLKSVFAESPAMVQMVDIAAKAVGVHAAIASDNAAPVTTAITNPVTPRSVQIVFTADWDGGDITIAGKDQFGRAQTEVIADNPGNTVEGVKVWKSITSISNETVGTGGGKTATVQTGPKIALPVPAKYAWGICLCDGVGELATWDNTYHAITPGTAPNGAHDYTLSFPVDQAKADNLNIG